MANLSAVELVKLSLKAWARERLLMIWGARSKWLYPVVIVAGALAYFPLKEHFITGHGGLTLSNLTTNLCIMIILWLWFTDDISTALWRKVFRQAGKAPRWFFLVILLVVIFGLIYYLTLWGYETRW